MDIVRSRNVVGKHLIIIAFKFLKFSMIEITDAFMNKGSQFHCIFKISFETTKDSV